jgi:hypothetical protein
MRCRGTGVVVGIGKPPESEEMVTPFCHTSVVFAQSGVLYSVVNVRNIGLATLSDRGHRMRYEYAQNLSTARRASSGIYENSRYKECD